MTTLPISVRPRVAIVATGGTIAGAAASASESLRYQSGALPVESLLSAVPSAHALADLEAEQLAAIDSKDADNAFWCALSSNVSRLLARDEVSGVVITHGTDTLEETAYWMHLTVRSEKPVVFTAAMRPATALSADGPANLYDAISLAASRSARGKGVLLAFCNRIHGARDVVKVSGHALDAFASPGFGPLGSVQDGRVTFQRQAVGRYDDMPFDLPQSPAVDFARPEGWEPEQLARVGIVVSHAGVTGAVVRALRAEGVQGIVVAGTGNGSVHASLVSALREAIEDGVAVVRSSRTGDCRVYDDGDRRGEGGGFVPAGTLNPYKARVLLMLALSSGIRSPDALREVFSAY